MIIAALAVAIATAPIPQKEPQVADPAFAAGFCAGYNLAADESARNVRHLHQLYATGRIKTGAFRAFMRVIEKAENGYAVVPPLLRVRDFEASSFRVKESWDVMLLDRDPELKFNCPEDSAK